jgi:hypothetical protein
MRTILLAAACAVAACAAAALAGGGSGAVKVQAPQGKTLTIATAQQHDCTRLQDAGATGVARETWSAPLDGYVHIRLKGNSRNDWDLGLFGADGSRRSASQSFGANEVVASFVRTGETVTLQACRGAGDAASMRLETTFVQLPGAGLGARPQRESLVRVKIPGRRGIELLQRLGFDLTESRRRDWAEVVLHTDAERKRLSEVGLPFTVRVADMAAAQRSEARKQEAWSRSIGGRSTLPTGRTDYRDYETIQAELKKLVADNPGRVRPVTLPHETYQGRSVEGIEIAKDVEGSDGRPTFFLMGVHHAREWPAAESPMEFAQMLVKGGDPRVDKIMAKTRTVVVPLINPDGYIESRSSPVDDPESSTPGGAGYTALALTGGGAQRRKNCFGALPGVAPCALQYGVDPNRNYGQFWGGPGASATPEQQDYRGPGPWSELETQNVHEFSQKHNVTALVTMHNVAALVLRAPGLKSSGLAPDELALKELGDAMGKATGYTSQYGWQLYDTTGTTEDWNYAAAGTFGYTIEMGPSGGIFHPNYKEGMVDQWDGIGKQAGRGLREALMLAAEAADNRTWHSVLTGRSQPGRVLTVKKDFTTFSSAVCTVNSTTGGRLITAEGTLRDTVSCANPGPVRSLKDGLEYTMTVPASGKFEWVITPSSRPFELRKGKAETWTLTCTDPGTKKVFDEQQVLIGRGEIRKIDMPCGGVLGPDTSLLDKLTPVTRFLAKTLKATRKGLYVQGTAKDRAPEGGIPELDRIAVAVGRRAGSRCQFLNAAGKAGRRTSCSRPKYLPAAGTSQWTFVLRKRLRPGRYIALVRGLDKAGNRERVGRANRIAFRVR